MLWIMTADGWRVINGTDTMEPIVAPKIDWPALTGHYDEAVGEITAINNDRKAFIEQQVATVRAIRNTNEDKAVEQFLKDSVGRTKPLYASYKTIDAQWLFRAAPATTTKLLDADFFETVAEAARFGKVFVVTDVTEG